MSTQSPKRGRRLGKGFLVAAITVALLVAGAWLGTASGLISNPASQSAAAPTSTDDNTRVATALDTITTGDLVETQEETGTVAHGDTWPLQIEADGIVTLAPPAGTTVDFGDTLIEIDAKPIMLAEGSVPLYRTLNYQARKHLKGPDVEQLQQFLVNAGHDDDERLALDGDFGRSTHRAVKAWQKDVGREQTGSVDGTQLVFSPEPVRVDTSLRVGSTFSELSVTKASQDVTAEFAARQQSFVETGSTVELQLGSGKSLTGTITETTSTVSDSGDRTIKVTVQPGSDLPDGTERLKVIASKTAASDVLIAPVRAILALAGGGYGLEVDTGNGRELRSVELGAVVDDLAEISGSFDDGEQVVVPIDLLDQDKTEDVTEDKAEDEADQ